MNQKTLDALASAIYVSRKSLDGRSIESDDERLRASGLYEDWKAGSYAAGDVRNTRSEDSPGNTQTWACFQAHDNAVYPDIAPGNTAWFTFWRPLHGTSPETARPFVPVQGAHDLYRAGEYMTLDGKLYRCLSDTAFSPAEQPEAWETAQNL